MKNIVNFRSLPTHIRDYHVHQLAISHDMIRIEEYLKSITDVDRLKVVSHKLEELINYFNSVDIETEARISSDANTVVNEIINTINSNNNETENTKNPKDCLGDN